MPETSNSSPTSSNGSPTGGGAGTSTVGSTDGAAADGSLGDLVRDASEQVSLLVRAELELARAEVAASVRRAGIGAALFAVAGVVALLSVPFLFVAAAEGMVAAGVWRWGAYLIVVGAFDFVALLLALVGWRSVKKVRKPERTLESVRRTAETFRRSSPA